MGYEVRVLAFSVSVRVDRHNGEEQRRDDALVEEMTTRLMVAIDEITADPKYKPITPIN
jgi:hypothetical protein